MDFSRIQDFDMQLLHVFNGSENVWLDQMAMALTSGWTWIPLYVVLFVVVIRNNEMMGQIALVVGGAVLCIFLADGLVDGIIKPLAERCRPSSDPMFKYTVQVVDNMRLKSFSFCSAHAANTLSIAIFFSLLIRSKLVTWTLLLWSLVNCWTRLYLGCLPRIKPGKWKNHHVRGGDNRRVPRGRDNQGRDRLLHDGQPKEGGRGSA